jgi:transcriptional regulator with XRE-family HTH domain
MPEKHAPVSNLRPLRESMGLTQIDVVRLCGVSPATVRGIESRSRSVSRVTKFRILNGLKKKLPTLTLRDLFPSEPTA